MSAIKYRPEVDGLRAIAVIPVVLFHLGASWIPGGFVGVDVFFVISGFLITSIILKEKAAGTFTFSGFWMRRVRRIMPAMLAMLFVTSIAGYFILFGPHWNSLGEQVISAIAIYANFEMWQLSGNYWGPAAENAPLLHTWSLSVEEQFYLFYPLLLLTLLKFTPKRVFLLILGGTVLSFALGVYATERSPSAAFYFLPTRAWELAAGCLLAIYERQRGPAQVGRLSRGLAMAGLVFIVLGYAFTNGADGFPGFWALMPVLGSVLVIRYAGSQECLAGRFLSCRPMVFVGKCSYSLYLWHWPVIVLANALKLKYPDSVNLPVVLVVICVLTLLSYYYVERPTRKLKAVLYPVGAGLVLSISASVFLQRAQYDYDFSVLEPTYAFGSAYDVAPVPPTGSEAILGVTTAPRTDSQYEAYRNDGIVKKYGGDTPDVVVLGSSHGMMWGRTIESICEELNLTVSFFTARAIPPWIQLPLEKKPIRNFTAEQRIAFDQQRLEKLKAWAPKVVIMVDRWSVRGDPFEHLEFLKFIESCGSQVILIGQPPELGVDGVSVPLFMAYQYNADVPAGRATLEFHRRHEVNAANDRIEELANALDFCHYIPVVDLYEVDGEHVLVRERDQILYIDEDHLSEAGVQRAKARMQTVIKDIFKKGNE